MSIRRRMTGLTAGLIVAGTAFAAPLAGAATQTESYPETPALNPDLPIIHTTHGSDHMKGLTPGKWTRRGLSMLLGSV